MSSLKQISNEAAKSIPEVATKAAIIFSKANADSHGDAVGAI